MSVTEELTHEQIFEIAHALGTEHGHAAGTWRIDGNTDAATVEALLAGIDAGDPEVMDTMPSPLASYDGTIAELVDETEIDYSTMDTDEARDVNDLDPFCNGYEAGFTSAYWAEVERSGRAVLDA